MRELTRDEKLELARRADLENTGESDDRQIAAVDAALSGNGDGWFDIARRLAAELTAQPEAKGDGDGYLKRSGWVGDGDVRTRPGCGAVIFTEAAATRVQSAEDAKEKRALLATLAVGFAAKGMSTRIAAEEANDLFAHLYGSELDGPK